MNTLFIVEELTNGVWEFYTEDTPGKFARPKTFVSLEDAETVASYLSREYNGLYAARGCDSDEPRTIYQNGYPIPLYKSCVGYQIEELRDGWWATLNTQILVYNWSIAAEIACGLSILDDHLVYRVTDPLHRRGAMRFSQGEPTLN